MAGETALWLPNVQTEHSKGLPGAFCDDPANMPSAKAPGGQPSRGKFWGKGPRGKRRDVKQNPYLNRNDDPRLKRTGFGFGLGSSKSLKKA